MSFYYIFINMYNKNKIVEMDTIVSYHVDQFSDTSLNLSKNNVITQFPFGGDTKTVIVKVIRK